MYWTFDSHTPDIVIAIRRLRVNFWKLKSMNLSLETLVLRCERDATVVRSFDELSPNDIDFLNFGVAPTE